MSAAFRRSAALAAPCLALLLHASLFGGWIIDDAGISFAYARSLAAGHGLVSQPGVEPVEGYSNFLWVLGFVPFFLLGLFDPVITPKALGLAMAAASLALLHGSLSALTGGRRLLSLTVPLLLAINTPFVAWTVSGLENPLYALLACLLLRLVVREREAEGPSADRYPWAAGAVAAALAMTRPDGVVFAALYPLLAPTLGGAAPARPPLRRWLLYAAAFALLFGGFLAFRLLYFGDLFPNTYYAKGGPRPADLLSLLTLQEPARPRLFQLMRSVAGPGNALVLAALVAGTAFLAGRRGFRWRHGALLAFTAAGAVPYLVLPPDWMGEYRFATPFFPFFYAYAATLCASLGEQLLPDPERRRRAGRAAALAALALSLALFLPRSLRFAAAPTFAEVVRHHGLRFNRLADMLGIREGSVLLPDLGGTLWVSRLRVYDLAGLADRTIARTRERDQKAFYDYVFEEAKPTFIHTHQAWTVASRFDLDPRFRRDYVPLYERVEPSVVRAARGVPLRSGDYVRKEAIRGKEAALPAVRAELARHYARQRP